MGNKKQASYCKIQRSSLPTRYQIVTNINNCATKGNPQRMADCAKHGCKKKNNKEVFIHVSKFVVTANNNIFGWGRKKLLGKQEYLYKP